MNIRTFVALELPADVKRAIAAAQVPELRAVRWVDAESAHLTLKFLGPTREEAVPAVEAALIRAAAGIGPLRLTTGDVGFFPSARRPRVVWLGIEGDVSRLQAAVEREVAPLGWPTEARAFHPHLTLGRVKEPVTLDGLPAPPPVSFEVNEVCLMQSKLSPKGARYSRLVAIHL